MKCPCGIMVSSSFIIALSLLLIGAAEGQVKNRLIPFPEWASSYDEDEEVPLALAEITVAGRPVILGQMFEANENWLKDMTLRVKNISDKPIIAFGVGGGLLRGVAEELPRDASFAYGVAWQWGKPFNPEKEKAFGVALKPGEIAELSYKNIDVPTRKVLSKEGEGTYSKIKFMAPSVQYSNGTVASNPKMKFYERLKP